MIGPDDLDALVSRAQAGDVRAFETLVAVHLPQVRRFARAFAAAEADADDLAQEALLKVFRALRTFRYQSSFSTWLFTVVRTTFLDQAKSRSRRAGDRPLGPEEEEAPSPAPPADERLAQEEERRRVWAALRQVPVEFRTAVVLFDIEGHAYDEVAAIEGVPVGTVRSRLSRGREHLRRALLEAGPPAREAAGDPPGTSLPPTSSHLSRSGS